VNPLTEFVQDDYSTASIRVYGPRDHAVPVLTTNAAAGDSHYSQNDVRQHTDSNDDDPKANWSTTELTYQLDSVTGLEKGTYMVMWQSRPSGGSYYSNALTTFQVGTATEQAKIATNCTDCHDGTRMHNNPTYGVSAFPFDTDYCLGCHDYKQVIGGDESTGWDDDFAGYGTPPASRFFHEVHRGAYLQSTEDFDTVIFPMDIRNCTKCHAETDDWKTEPGRMPCLGCHDGEDAMAHASLQTVDPTPEAPFSGDEVESCAVCHEAGAEFGVDKMHNISDPYAPPYPREPAEAE
jgi:hypothetical protein